jgi:hypothetical protein
MLTHTGGRNLFGQLTINASTTNLSIGDVLINEGTRIMLGDIAWPFLETTTTALTVSGTQSYAMPGNMDRLIDVYILVGTLRYNPTEVTNFDEWNRLNASQNIQSDAVSAFFIQGDNILFWPTPSTNSNTITYEYLLNTRDISVADYTTGTIVTATNGSATITGSGTSWNAGMVGKWIRITADSTANKGDGIWYKISGVASATSLTISAVYTGVSITAGAAAYTIGDCSFIPEKYQIGPIYYAVAEYYRKAGDDGKADRYEQKFEETLRRMRHDEGTKTSQVVIDDNVDRFSINPNLNMSATG